MTYLLPHSAEAFTICKYKDSSYIVRRKAAGKIISKYVNFQKFKFTWDIGKPYWSLSRFSLNQKQKYIYLLTLPYKQDVTQGQFFKPSLTGLNSVFFLLDQLPYQG